MKALIVEDEFTSRFLLQEILDSYGPTHIAINGMEAVEAVQEALEIGENYDLICMDIMMPEMDGKQAVNQIRTLESARGIFSTNGAKIIMTTALNDIKTVYAAYENLADGYIVKPIDKAKLLDELRKLGLIK